MSSHFAKLRLRFLADVRRRMVRPIRVVNAALPDGRRPHRQACDEPAAPHPGRDPVGRRASISHRSFPIDHFVCADQRLCDVATSEGLKVHQPRSVNVPGITAPTSGAAPFGDTGQRGGTRAGRACGPAGAVRPARRSAVRVNLAGRGRQRERGPITGGSRLRRFTPRSARRNLTGRARSTR